ncbi:MAG TPA: hypothetical protein VNA21_16810 [Steroidobacteraceae bacterium]|nr:hypothetical protein [Steroidobacteraceae bacterium]
MQQTFNDGGKREADFLTQFLVRCPRCEKRALVRSDGIPWTVTGAKLTCSSCGHNDSWTGRAAGAAVKTAKRRCPQCARWLEKRFSGSPAQREVHQHCPSCRIVVREPVSWARIPGSLTRDPYFDCALWFVGDIKGNVFWAYNQEHLQFIRDYVAATLRIRQPNKNSSLASRLPAFLLAKKNRAAVLKEIDRMAAA